MSRKRTQWMNDVASVQQMRDELRLKAHLLRNDARQQWEALEKQWTHLERDLAPVGGAVRTSAKEIGASTMLLLKTVHAGYTRIRQTMRDA